MGRSSETGARGLLHLMCGCFTERSEEQQYPQQPTQCDDDDEDGAAKHSHFASRAGEMTGIIGTDVPGTPASLTARQVHLTIPASYGQDASDWVGGQWCSDTGGRPRYGGLSAMNMQPLNSGQGLQHAQAMTYSLQGQLMQPVQQTQTRQVMQPMQPMQTSQLMQPMQQMHTMQPMQQAHAHGGMQHMQPMQQVSMQPIQPMQLMQPMQPMIAAQSMQAMGERQQGQAHQSMQPIQPNYSPLVMQAMRMNQAVQQR